MVGNYQDFLRSKLSTGDGMGFAPVHIPDQLFDFQKALVDRAVRAGRLAVFADCGMGKSFVELSWAENVVRKTNKNVLIVTVLAAVNEILKEAEKFGIDAKRSNDGKVAGKITVTNYEKLHLFDPADYEGVACDESSILKNLSGARKKIIVAFTRNVKYRLLATATPSPNDYTELGSSSECLGGMGPVDMLSKYFRNNQNDITHGVKFGQSVKWSLKGHAHDAFWHWVSSWAVALRKPSDLGFSDEGFQLPPLTHSEILVKTETIKDGMLFHVPAVGLREQREEGREYLGDRARGMADLINGKTGQSIAWCNMNDEGDLLEKSIDDCVQVSGRDSDEKKEEKFKAFIEGQVKVLVTKPKIGAWGLNLQNCNHMAFFPSHSYEQYYQAVRRCWRFGQKRPVHVDVVATEGELGVLQNLQRKNEDAERMFEALVGKMNSGIDLRHLTQFKEKTEVPSWL